MLACSSLAAIRFLNLIWRARIFQMMSRSHRDWACYLLYLLRPVLGPKDDGNDHLFPY
jgi:hypothetical protein